jgi:spermidine synthase
VNSVPFWARGRALERSARVMIRWQSIGRAPVPGSSQVLELFRRGDEWSLRVDGLELMNSRQHGSEDMLSELICAAIADRPSARVMIGGLGLGFSLATALARLGPGAELVVSELVPAVVEWNRGELGALAGHPLRDPRVRVELGDVGALIAAARERYDGILLDVDNGPSALTHEDNDALYRDAGLRAAFDALRAGGVLGVWSASRAPGFAQRLRRSGFEAQEHAARGRGPRGGARHTLWIARKPERARLPNAKPGQTDAARGRPSPKPPRAKPAR